MKKNTLKGLRLHNIVIEKKIAEGNFGEVYKGRW